MRKPDETILLIKLLDLHRAYKRNGGKMYYVREVVKELGIPEKRAAYILEKHTSWYNYGISSLAGWVDDVDELTRVILEEGKT